VLAKFNTSGKMLELHSFAKGEDAHEKPGDLNWFHAVALDQAARATPRQLMP
jgi:hypothetical protein